VLDVPTNQLSTSDINRNIHLMSNRVPTETTENKGIALRYPVLESKIGRS